MGFLSSLFGVSDRTPETKQIVQTSKLPEELSPYVQDVLSEAQTMYKADTERGYDPYTGQMIADFTPQEQQAMAGLESLVGTTRPYLEEAVETYRRGGDEFTAEVAEQYMSPYQRAVTDIQKREAQRDFEGTTLPRLEAQAIQQGAMSGLGSRAGVEMAEAQRNQSQLLADIEAKGQQAAFADARTAFEAQKARERAMAGDVARTGTAQLAAGLQEQGVLQTVGEQQRGMGQAILDEAYGRFLEERNFPKQTLSDYSSTVYGAAPSFAKPSITKSTSSLPGAPSMGQQLLGLGMAGLNAYQSGGLGTLMGGGNPFMPKRAEGGPVIEAQAGGPPTRSRLSPEQQLKRRQALLGLDKKEEVIWDSEGNIVNPAALNMNLPTAGFPANIQLIPDKLFAEESKFTQYEPRPGKTEGGLSGLVTKPKTTVARQNPAVNPIQPNNADMVDVTRRDLQRAKGRFDNVISVLGMGDTISGGTLKGVKIPDIDIERAKITTEVSQDSRFDPNTIRKRNEAIIKQTVGELRKNIENKEKIQEAGYEEESAEMDTFLNDQIESIKEDGATTSDIMAEAIDQGMKEPTIVTMLTKVLNTNEKGVQKRAREVRKELRDLKKTEFTIKKESRKEKRTDKLANAQLKSEATLKKIAMILNMEEKLALVPSQKQAEIARRLAENIQLRGSVIKNVKDVYSIAGSLLKEATSGTTRTGKPQSMVAFVDLIRKDMTDGTRYILGKNEETGADEIRLPNGNALNEEQTKEYMREFNAKKKAFTNRFRELDPTMSNYDAMNRAYADTQTGSGGPRTSGGQAGSSSSNPINPTGMTQAQINALPRGTWMQTPNGIRKKP